MTPGDRRAAGLVALAALAVIAGLTVAVVLIGG